MMKAKKNTEVYIVQRKESPALAVQEKLKEKIWTSILKLAAIECVSSARIQSTLKLSLIIYNIVLR